MISRNESKIKKFTCFDCKSKFEKLPNLNKHIGQTGCNEYKLFDESTYLKRMIDFLFKPINTKSILRD
jgi:hypothetical protein